MAKWHQKYRVDWDATDGRNGGAQRTVWEILMEMEKVEWENKGRRPRSGGLGTGPSEGLRACQFPCGLGLGNTLQLPKEDFRVLCGLFRAPEEGTVRRMCGRAVTNHHGRLARVQVELFAVARCVAGCFE